MNSFSAFSQKLVVVSTQRFAMMLLVGLLVCSPSVFGQRNLGQIYGTVTDTSGAVVAGTTVTVTDVARGVTRTLTTDNAGEYSAPSLVPSTYVVRGEATGFNAVELQDIVVGVGEVVRIDLTLHTGAQKQVVTVTAATPIVNTTDAMLSSTVSAKTLTALPLNGRLYTKVMDYMPGISANPGGGTPTYESNGAGNSNQEWMLDGIDDVNEWAASGPLFGAATSSDELTILPLDSIEEVNVMANPPAEYGWENGAVVNVGLKSGTNTMHGSAYADGRDTALDAESPYLHGLPKGDDLFEQFGGAIGGPIVKDKLFYFGNYEGFRYTEGSPSTVQVPSSLPNAGGPSQSFPDAIADLEANGIQPTQLSLNLAGCNALGVCDPSKGIFNNGTTNTTAIPTGLDNIGKSDNFLARVDYHPNDRNSINGEYVFGNARDDTAGLGVQPYWGNTDFNRNMVVRAVWVNVPNSRWVNEARFGYDRYDLQDYNTECTQQVGQPNYAKDFGFVSGVNAPPPECGFPVISIAGFTNLGAGQFIQDQLVFQNTWHFVDTVSYVRGKHQMAFGFEFNHTLYRGYGAPNFFDGNVAFNGGLAFPGSSSLEDFLAGTSTLGQVLVNPPQTTLGFNRYAGFFQDNWRIIPRLVLNLGLRYEHEPPVQGNNNSLGNFDPNAPSGMVQQSGGALYHTDWRDFGPRVGFAWDVTGKGTTVIRAGTSVAYDSVPLASLASSQGANLALIPTGFTLFNADGSIRPSPGNIRSGTATLSGSEINWVYNAPGASPVVPVFNTSGSALACGNGLGTNPPQCFLLAVSPDLPRSPMLTWTVGVQHAFTSKLSLTAAYVATHAYELPELVNVNQPAPGTNNPAAEELRRPYSSLFPYFGDILQYSAVGYSDYSGLQLGLVQQTSHGLTMKLSYTLASAKTTQSFDSDGPPFLKDSTNVSSSYARMEEPRNNIGFELTYDIPGKKGFGHLLEGWAVDNAITLRSGLGVDTQDTADDFAGIDTVVVGSYWNLYGSRSAFKNFGKGATVPCFGAPGSTFAASGCSTPVPQECISAAASEPTNPNVPSTDPNATGSEALANFGCYMEGNSVIVPPAQGTLGNMFRNELIGPWFREWNFSVTKEWKLSERFTTQFRADFFNLLNNRNYGFVSGSPNVPSIFGLSLSPVNAGNLVNGTGDARRIALGLRVTF
jgi:carboxypeptidase family protein